MNLIELQARLKEISDYNKAIYGLFRKLKEHKEEILELNKDQLFNKHVGADNVILGYYSNNRDPEQYDGPGPPKEPGQPFTMIDTGLFKSGLRIEFYYRHISIRSEYHYQDLDSNPFFNTTEFYGLTEENFELFVEQHVKPLLLEWMRETLSGANPNVASAGTI